MSQSQIVSIQVSLPRLVGVAPGEPRDPGGEPYRTGFFKQPVAGPVWLGATNLVGDGQGDTRNHGGPDKAVLAYAAAHYPIWRDELAWPDLSHGAFGENFTIAGLDEASVCIGDVYTIGAAAVQVSQPRQPCWKIDARWQRRGLTARVEQSGRTGWYLRVLREGSVQAGDAVALQERPNPEWSVTRTTGALRDRADLAAAATLAAMPELAEWMRGYFARRAAA